MMNSQSMPSETNLQQWESIDWKLLEEKIRTLQARIVKAQQAGETPQGEHAGGRWRNLVDTAQ